MSNVDYLESARALPAIDVLSMPAKSLGVKNPQAVLPPFAWDELSRSFTQAGRLWVRMTPNMSRLEHSVLDNVLFSDRGIGIMGVTTIKEKVHVVVRTVDDVLILTDDVNLFPSDSLLTKINLLRK